MSEYENEVGLITPEGFRTFPVVVDVDESLAEERGEHDPFGADADARVPEAATRGVSSEHKIAQLPNIPQFKVVWKNKEIGFGIKTKVPQLFRRLKKVHVFLRITRPDGFPNEVLTKCLLAGLGAAGAAYLSGVGALAAKVAFTAAFTGCLGDEGEKFAKQLKLHLHTDEEYTPWKAA